MVATELLGGIILKTKMENLARMRIFSIKKFYIPTGPFHATKLKKKIHRAELGPEEQITPICPETRMFSEMYDDIM